jgi:2-phospho-L-lactate transferase/gluconeogenesis factor (CofD/UPF0052 family)
MMMMMRRTRRLESGPVVALCGGIGGAKLALGLYRVLERGRLTVVANTGDDFEHLGLHISPDIDTIIYTLSRLSDPERAWGRADESWNFMAALSELGVKRGSSSAIAILPSMSNAPGAFVRAKG